MASTSEYLATGLIGGFGRGLVGVSERQWKDAREKADHERQLSLLEVQNEYAVARDEAGFEHDETMQGEQFTQQTEEREAGETFQTTLQKDQQTHALALQDKKHEQEVELQEVKGANDVIVASIRASKENGLGKAAELNVAFKDIDNRFAPKMIKTLEKQEDMDLQSMQLTTDDGQPVMHRLIAAIESVDPQLAADYYQARVDAAGMLNQGNLNAGQVGTQAIGNINTTNDVKAFNEKYGLDATADEIKKVQTLTTSDIPKLTRQEGARLGTIAKKSGDQELANAILLYFRDRGGSAPEPTMLRNRKGLMDE